MADRIRMKEPSKATCSCLPRVQEKLMADYDCHIVIENLVNFKTGAIRDSPPQVRLEKNDTKSRKKLATLFCVYCPFCGERY